MRVGETVEVHRMAPEDVCTAEMLVLIRWHGRVMAVPLSQLAAIDPVPDSERVPLHDLRFRRYGECRNRGWRKSRSGSLYRAACVRTRDADDGFLVQCNGSLSHFSLGSGSSDEIKNSGSTIQ